MWSIVSFLVENHRELEYWAAAEENQQLYKKEIQEGPLDPISTEKKNKKSQRTYRY